MYECKLFEITSLARGPTVLNRRHLQLDKRNKFVDEKYFNGLRASYRELIEGRNINLVTLFSEPCMTHTFRTRWNVVG